jgi:hypothetical protein
MSQDNPLAATESAQPRKLNDAELESLLLKVSAAQAKLKDQKAVVIFCTVMTAIFALVALASAAAAIWVLAWTNL